MREVRLTSELRYRYAAGRWGTAFLEGLREGRIVASRCAKCPRTLVPPRIACTGCYGPMEERVELPPRGRLLAWTVVAFPFIDPTTGVQRPVPYGYGMVQFDGADNTFQYFLADTDAAKLRVGARVEAVFRDERTGALADLLHFRVIE